MIVLQEVNIYIDVKFKGRLESGTGTYSIVLEYIKNNIPHTREYIEGYTDTTENRVSILAIANALNHLKRPCKVNIIINTRFVYQAITQEWYKKWIKNSTNAKGEPANNVDLWVEFSHSMQNHEVNIKYAKRNEYSKVMLSRMERSIIEYLEDRGRKIMKRRFDK